MSTHNSLSYFSLISFLLLIITNRFASASLLQEVCRRTQDQAFCTRVLGSDSRTRNVEDLPGLAKIAIDLAFYDATATKLKIHSLYLSAKDPQQKARLATCDESYGDAIDALKLATADLKQKHIGDLSLRAEDINEDGNSCEKRLKHPPAFKSPFTNENNDLERFGDIISAISTLLRGNM